MNGSPTQQDAVPGTAVPTGALVSPGGAQGPQGIQGPGGTGPTGSQGPVGPEGMLIGTIFAWPSLTPPTGSLLCDGSAQSRNTFANLYTILGGVNSPFGQGDGSTTFNLPNLLGRMILGGGQGTGLTNRVLGATGGEETHVLSIAEMAAHSHGITISDPGHAHVVPAHGHSFSDPGHAHSISDPGHAHSVSDPAHAHPLLGYSYHGAAGGGNDQPGYCAQPAYGAGNPLAQPFRAGVNNTVQAAGTGIGIYAAGTGIGIYAATTGASVVNAAAFWDNSNTTGISASEASIGSSSGHNTLSPFLVLTYCIKASYPVPVGPTVPLADTTQAGLLTKVSGLATDYIGGDNTCHDLPSQIKLVAPIVRSFNSISNPNFEIDMRTAGAGSSGANGTWGQDRWLWGISTTGAAAFTGKQTASLGGVVLPGANFSLSSSFYRITLTAQQATLGASDAAWLQQAVEGIRLRELIAGVTSATLVLRSSVPNITIGLALQSGTPTYSLTLSVALTAANTWTIVSLPNIAAWSTSATWPLGPGTVGYTLSLCLFAGSSLMATANNIWQASNVKGASGQSNFAASPVGSTLDIAFVQHEPGASTSGIIDKEYTANRQDCLRYFYKSYEDSIAVGASGAAGEKWMNSFAAGYGFGTISLPVSMAKVPVITAYNYSNGTINQATSYPGNISYTVTSAEVTTKSLDYISMTSSVANQSYRFHFVADTGW